ncbi:hypothetical protein C1H46_043759 [Malus baccata]|uniref:Uncharacterized protein n=1 Tax=Malus baccata TaxID=106549 RepID=A0A540K907_MALBA|nr:hypothetical protein C1H46_043759 [Malus baccata]
MMAGSSALYGGDGVMVAATAVVLSKMRESSRGFGTCVIWDVVVEDGWMGGVIVGRDSGEAG